MRIFGFNEPVNVIVKEIELFFADAAGIAHALPARLEGRGFTLIEDAVDPDDGPILGAEHQGTDAPVEQMIGANGNVDFRGIFAVGGHLCALLSCETAHGLGDMLLDGREQLALTQHDAASDDAVPKAAAQTVD